MLSNSARQLFAKYYYKDYKSRKICHNCTICEDELNCLKLIYRYTNEILIYSYSELKDDSKSYQNQLVISLLTIIIKITNLVKYVIIVQYAKMK